MAALRSTSSLLGRLALAPRASTAVQTAGFRASALARADDPNIALKSKESSQVDLDPNRKTSLSEPSIITVFGPATIAEVSGVPEEHIKERYVRVYRPAKNAMQSGTAGVRRWKIEFESRQRWENPLMGWASSGDPLSNMQVDFASKEEAIAFVEKNGWDYFVEDPKERAPKVKSYALNFAWNKRTRKSTK